MSVPLYPSVPIEKPSCPLVPLSPFAEDSDHGNRIMGSVLLIIFYVENLDVSDNLPKFAPINKTDNEAN